MFEKFDDWLVENKYKKLVVSYTLLMLGVAIIYRRWEINCTYTNGQFIYKCFVRHFNASLTLSELNNYEVLLRQFLEETQPSNPISLIEDVSIISIQEINVIGH